MRILLAEDDRTVRVTLRDALDDAGHDVVACEDGKLALAAALASEFDVLLADIRMPGLTGLELFRRVRVERPGLVVILMTGYPDTNDTVAAIREGAWDYIGKPFEPDELLLRLARVAASLEAKSARELGGHSPPQPPPVRAGASPTSRLEGLIEAAAQSHVPVLITGETGTGKDRTAHRIHALSGRASRPFVAVNCGALPETLLESELFGHERGAFTGADRRRVGRFEAAHGGTLFLDEVGELTLTSQVKLLRAIDTSSFEPLGSNRTVTVDIRIIAATNRDLAAAVERGQFRQDLFYRLNVLGIRTVPLRDRRAELPSLIDELLGTIAARYGRAVPIIHPCVSAALACHDYPGNVRELIHALERAVALARGGELRLDHLPEEIATAASDCDGCRWASLAEASAVEPLAQALEHYERQYIRTTLDKVGGHRSRAAAILGISRKSLWQRLKETQEKDSPEEP